VRPAQASAVRTNRLEAFSDGVLAIIDRRIDRAIRDAALPID
jgi:hypothetical protein